MVRGLSRSLDTFGSSPLVLLQCPSLVSEDPSLRVVVSGRLPEVQGPPHKTTKTDGDRMDEIHPGEK